MRSRAIMTPAARVRAALRSSRRFRSLGLFACLLLLLLFFTGSSLRHILSPWEWSWPYNAYRTRLPVPRSIPREYIVPDTLKSRMIPDTDEPPPRRANAALVMLARNYDLPGVLAAMKQVEDRFNKRFKYPWVLLNEVQFSKSFIKATKAITDAEVIHGFIEPSEWFQPDWIDDDKAEVVRLAMEKDRIPFAKSVSWRNMCRFNAGFFFKNKYLQPYRWYWRIEPNVEYLCDIKEDPFLHLQDRNMIYGFVMSTYENPATIPTLWPLVKEFTKANPQYIAPDNAMKFISRDDGTTYNQCHFWTNFEIGDMTFWRGEAYQKFFKFIDDTGGFYYERWADAPVHSIALSLFANRSSLHFFEDIGYRHHPYQHCPGEETRLANRCSCMPGDTFDNNRFSCLNHFTKMMEAPSSLETKDKGP